MSVSNSPDAAKIYQQYLTYYNDINSKIGDIDSLPHDKWIQPNVQQDRATLLSSQQALGPIYQKDYSDSNATLASFEKDCAAIEARVTSAYNDAMGHGGSPIYQQIQADFTAAQGLLSTLMPTLNQDQDALNSVPALQASLNNLQQQINAMTPGPKRDKAQSDLNIALSTLISLQTDIAAASPGLASFQSQMRSAMLPGGILDKLVALASLQNPTFDDLKKASIILGVLQNISNQLQSFQNGIMGQVNSDLTIVNNAIQAVQADIRPTPTPGKIEHACWYVDWTSWDFTIPEGVNMVNLFVGTLAIVNGQPTVNGFGNMTLDKLDAFVKACQNHQPPIPVKISIGGGGGSYDNCWDLVTPDNVQAFAQGLVDFCHTHGVVGIDFDYEEQNKPQQQSLIGTLIKAFKAIDPSLQTSLCTNAGFGPNYPWQAEVKNILDTAAGSLDRLYIMSYYNTLQDEEGWLDGWAAWAKQNYGMDPSQITVGIDDTDAKAYNIADISKFAGQRGYSTGYWYWNPATPTQSNQSTTTILNSYAPPVTRAPLTRNAQGSLTLQTIGEQIDDLLVEPVLELFDEILG